MQIGFIKCQCYRKNASILAVANGSRSALYGTVNQDWIIHVS